VSEFTLPWQPKRGVEYGGAARAVIAVARGVYQFAAPIVSRFPGLILILAVIGSCLLVWFHALLFGYVDAYVLGGTAMPEGYEHAKGLSTGEPARVLSPSTWGLPPSVIAARLEAAGGVGGALSGLLQYLLWPVQFVVTRDLIGVIGIFALFNIIPIYAIWWERKVAGRIQSRLGPMRVGGWHGWAQSFADGIKLMMKEDIIPADADKPLFRAAAYFALIPALLAFVALPFGFTYVFRDLDVALVFILGILGIEVVGVIVAGWASNNKWSVYGAMREACQMVSYEIPMGMALLIPVVTVGSLNLRVIGEAQSEGWFSWLAFSHPFAFAAFLSYYVASLASCKRAPFDLPEAESELVAGFHTEYSGLRWSLFFFAEYAAMFIVSALAAILFLGAWHSPLPMSWAGRFDGWIAAGGLWKLIGLGLKGLLFSSPIWLLLKAVFFIYVQMWLRWTLPRIRIDQVLYACVQVMLPLTMLLLIGTALWVWASSGESAAWKALDAVVRYGLGVVGMLFALAFMAIAAYGFYKRRKLVGRLAVDALPGA